MPQIRKAATTARALTYTLLSERDLGFWRLRHNTGIIRYYGANAEDFLAPTPIFSSMGEIRTVTTLRAKREEIIHSIRLYEKQIAQARADLMHITAAIRIFEASGDPKEMSRYVDTYRMFKRGEPIDLCKEVLASGPKPTRELALHVMAAKVWIPETRFWRRP